MAVREIWRFPVKSMQGEPLDEIELGPAGVIGDRTYAVIDAADGKVASAKNPRKWAGLLACRARYLAPPDGNTPAPVEITLPDGTVTTSDAADVDTILSRHLGRDVRLASAVPEAATFEETWPNIDDIAPRDFIDSTTVRTDDDESVSDLALALAAPGSFFDLAPVHLVTASSLTEFAKREPTSEFGVLRFRPNFVIDGPDAGFVENDWVGATVQLGADAQVSVMMPTMRCVMTTLAQPGLPADRAILRAAAAHNRVEIGGMGQWACVGAYASVVRPGAIATGDRVDV